MYTNEMFYLNSLLLGVGLAVDAFIIALANGMNGIGGKKGFTVAALLAVFQFAAVMAGWAVAYAVTELCGWLEKVFSWLAVAVFLYMGVKSFVSAANGKGRENSRAERNSAVGGVLAVILQCAAASVDALTVGFTVEEYGVIAAIVCSAIIAAVTFVLYVLGHVLGKHFGERLGKCATVIGGIAFVAIAVEIIVTTYV